MKARILDWIRRYLPLEILATVTALIGGMTAAVVTANAVVISYAGAWGENVGYYGYAFAREMRRLSAASPEAPRMGFWARSAATIRGLVWEFGLAELIDSFLARPFCMLAATALLGSLELGIVAGKLAADVLFYAIAIFFYELGKRW